MSNRIWKTAVEHVEALVAPQVRDSLSDAELLHQFLLQRDEASFAAIVRRHGPLVWGVCRQLLANECDAEDAYQATFLALFQQAQRIQQPNALGAWLHGVAGRVCRQSLRTRGRRQRREQRAAASEATHPIASIAWDEWYSLVHREIERLPETLRVPFVMCVLQGVPQSQAAQRLGWKIGTLSGRICKAKQALMESLERHGTMGATIVSTTLGAGTFCEPLSAHLVEIGTAMATLARESLSPVVHQLTHSAMGNAMTSLKWFATATTTLILLGAGTFYFTQQPADSSPPPAIATVKVGADSHASKQTGTTKEVSLPFTKASQWLANVKSMHIRAEEKNVKSPDGIARSLRDIKAQFPDQKEPDPLMFTGLLPESERTIEYDFDSKRLRSLSTFRTSDQRSLDRQLDMWDGKRALHHVQYFKTGQNQFRLTPTTERVAESYFMNLSFLSRQPPIFWWNEKPQARKDFEQLRGTPDDYVMVGREMFHGVECEVFLNTIGNQSDRYYVGAKDKRWYGAKEGIIVFPKELQRIHQSAIEEVLGKKIADDASESAWEAISKELDTLTPEKKANWQQLHYDRIARHFPPVFEYWFSDYRDLGDGRVFPFREEVRMYDHEAEKIYLDVSRNTVVKEFTLDQPLADSLFHEDLTEGAQIADDTHQPPLFYKHKAKFTPEEWARILKQAKEHEESETANRMSIDRLIGQPAPPLPTGEWLNSKPLTWADLKGKVVVLKFWSIDCPPCYPELAVLKEAPNLDTDEIVLIGVHLPGRSKDEIEKVVSKYELKAPLCIDRAARDSQVGEFFDGCSVIGMPTSVAIDEQGRVLAHGRWDEVISVAAQHRAKIIRKKE